MITVTILAVFQSKKAWVKSMIQMDTNVNTIYQVMKYY